MDVPKSYHGYRMALKLVRKKRDEVERFCAGLVPDKIEDGKSESFIREVYGDLRRAGVFLKKLEKRERRYELCMKNLNVGCWGRAFGGI